MSYLRTNLLALRSILTKKIPFYVQFAVTKKCNLRCTMCQAVESRIQERELSLREIEDLADLLSRLNVVFLILTGGEPLLREDLTEIVEIFTKKKICVRLQTNGIGISEQRIKSLISAGLKDVTISLDSLFHEKQDLITRRDGSWNEAMKAISFLSRYLPGKASFCGVNIVVSKFNLDEVVRLVRFVSDIGFYASLIPIHLSANASFEYIIRANNNLLAFDKSDYGKIDQVYSEVIKLKKKGAKIYNSYRFLRESPDFLKYNKTYWRCYSPDIYFSISPSGNFLPCVDIKMDEPMLGGGDFVKTYYSKEFRDRVRKVIDKCGGCMYACWPEISYLSDDFSVFLSRVLERIRVMASERMPMNLKEVLEIAEKNRTL